MSSVKSLAKIEPFFVSPKKKRLFFLCLVNFALLCVFFTMFAYIMCG